MRRVQCWALGGALVLVVSLWLRHRHTRHVPAASVLSAAWPGGPSSPAHSAARCPAGVALRRPSAAGAGTWQPQPPVRRTLRQRSYEGVAGRPPVVPTWILTSGDESSTIYSGASPFRFASLALLG